jgi:hypothetical protein
MAAAFELHAADGDVDAPEEADEKYQWKPPD